MQAMASNPCLTVLLVYSAIITISLVITSALLATNHGRSVVCSGEGVEEEVVNTHYSVFDDSHDEVEEKDSKELCKCHCNCYKEELITGVEVFGTSGRRCSRSALGGRLATTLVDHYFHHYFLFFFILRRKLFL